MTKVSIVISACSNKQLSGSVGMGNMLLKWASINLSCVTLRGRIKGAVQGLKSAKALAC